MGIDRHEHRGSSRLMEIICILTMMLQNVQVCEIKAEVVGWNSKAISLKRE